MQPAACITGLDGDSKILFIASRKAARAGVEAAFVAGRELPLRRDLAVLFVDMVDSTRLLMSLKPESMLDLIQNFMETVV